MSSHRHEHRGRITINAPIERVYAVAVDPRLVPRYATEIREIRHQADVAPGTVDVQSRIRILGFTVGFDYRYQFVSPHFYGGVQRKRALVRGYFTMRFKELDGGATEVEHVEGIVSRVPMVARVAGWIWFGLLSWRGIDDELRRLKALVEADQETDSQNLSATRSAPPV